MPDFERLKRTAWESTTMYPRDTYAGAWARGAEDMSAALRPEIERLEAIEQRLKHLMAHGYTRPGDKYALHVNEIALAALRHVLGERNAPSGGGN